MRDADESEKDNRADGCPDIFAACWRTPGIGEFFGIPAQARPRRCLERILGLSRDRPELYGDDMLKNAVVEFLYHIFYQQPDELPALVTGFLAGFSREIPALLSAGLKKDLAYLGYPAEELEKIFSSLCADTREQPGRRLP